MITQILKDHGYMDRLHEISKLDGMFTKVGFPGKGRLRRGDSSDKKQVDDMSEIIKIAATHEFGAPSHNIPERSFLRTAYDENFTALQEFKKSRFALVVTGKLTAKQAFAQIGEWFTNKVKEKIRSNIPPPNSEKTIARKSSSRKRTSNSSSRTLIDTAQMLNSVQHVEGSRDE